MVMPEMTRSTEPALSAARRSANGIGARRSFTFIASAIARAMSTSKPMISPVFVVMLRGGMLAAVPTTSSALARMRPRPAAEDGAVVVAGAQPPRRARITTADDSSLARRLNRPPSPDRDEALGSNEGCIPNTPSNHRRPRRPSMRLRIIVLTVTLVMALHGPVQAITLYTSLVSAYSQSGQYMNCVVTNVGVRGRRGAGTVTVKVTLRDVDGIEISPFLDTCNSQQNPLPAGSSCTVFLNPSRPAFCTVEASASHVRAAIEVLTADFQVVTVVPAIH